MKRALRVLGIAVGVLLLGVVVAGAVFWVTIPPLPALPDGFAPPPDSSVTKPELRDELLQMKALDQAIRDSALVPDMTTITASGMWRLAQNAVRLARVDGPNTERLAEIVAEHGWPSRAQVGADGREAIFLIVQHADRSPAFQRSALEPMREAYRDGDASGSNLALLTDRVRLAEGRTQLYGSQISTLPGEPPSLRPLEDPETVDVRRAELGLEPLAEYLEELCQEAGVCVTL